MKMIETILRWLYGIIATLLIVVVIVAFVYTITTEAETEAKEKVSPYNIEVIESKGKIDIVYDTETRVMYYATNNGNYWSTLTPIYNADGSLQVYNKNNESEK